MARSVEYFTAPSPSSARTGSRTSAPVTDGAARRRAIRAGWNDAAWSRPAQAFAAPLARFYAAGYAGGLVYRTKLTATD